MIKKIVLFSLIFLFVGCSQKQEPLPTVIRVDLNRYLGTWYEIARFEHFFEEGCKNVTANYSLLENEKIKVINKCTMIEDGEINEAIGKAYAVDRSFSKLKVTFFWPFYGDYWIVFLDEKYKVALVGSPNREYLWILSRTKTIDEKTKERFIDIAAKNGFDTSKFIWTIQE